MASPRHPLQEGSFDPLALLQHAGREGGSESRNTMLRVLWLRQRVPEARIATSLVSTDDRGVVMSASISLPDGGQGSGHSASPVDGEMGLADAVEAAEMRAIGRALDVLGYVVTENSPTSGPREQATSTPTTQPVPREERRTEPPGHVQALRQMKEREDPVQEQARASTPVGPYLEEQEAATETPAPRAEPSQEPAALARVTPRETTEQTPADDGSEPEMADISWTAFWDWARSTYQLKSRGQLEELLGQTVGNKNPGQLRDLVIAHFGADSDIES